MPYAVIMTNHNGVISSEFDNGEFNNNDFGGGDFGGGNNGNGNANNGDFGSEDSADGASNGLHAGRESSVVPGRFGEDLHVSVAKYSRGEAAAYATRPLLLLLHGWGSNEDDLLDLMRVVAPYNDAISLRAPLRLAQGAYSWFHDAVPNGDDLDRDMYAAAAAIDEWVAANVPEDRAVVPFGFSQGAALAIHVLRLNPDRYRASVALSGFVAPNIAKDISLNDDVLADLNTPVFFGYGLDDAVIAPYEFSAAAAWLEEHTWLEEKRYRGLDHAVHMEELGDIRSWLALHNISSGLM